MSKDYYKILGISKTASQDEVKAAFRRLAIEHHPDKGGNAEKFKEINEAYQALGDVGKRKQYDQFGSGFENMNRGGFGGGQNPFGQGFGGFQNGNINFEDLGDIFGDIFNFGGGGRTSKRESRGKDIEIDLSIDFMESVFGVEREVELYKNSECDACGGSGAEPGSKVSTCSRCKGNGKLEQIARSFLGSYRTVVTCDVCNGSGKKAEKECKKCRGNGISKQSKKIEIKVPAGVSDGETLRLSGQGEASRGGRSGDLYINLRVRDHNIFNRDGFNILSKIIINFPDATLGLRRDVETVDGPVEVKIPAGIQSGQIMRLSGKGIPYLRRNGRGDHLLEIVVETPKHLSRKQKKLIEELKEELG